MDIIIILDENGIVEGKLFLDDGDIIDIVENGKFYLLLFKFNGIYFLMNIIIYNEIMVDSICVGSMIIFGMKREIISVIVNNVNKFFEKLKLYNKLYIKDLGVML